MSKLFILATVVGLSLAVILGWVERTRLNTEIEELSSQLRQQIETSSYRMGGRLLARGQGFSVYSLRTESVFPHVLRFTPRSEQGLSVTDAQSFLQPSSNLWESDLTIVELSQGEHSKYFLSGIAGEPRGEALAIATTRHSGFELSGFGEVGSCNEPIDIEIWGDATQGDGPFTISLLNGGKNAGRSQ